MRKVVLVTGASRGIGKATAIKFAKEGWQVVVNFRSTINKRDFIGDNFHFVKADITKEDEVENMFKEIKENFGKIDALVNNAGVVFDRDMEKITEKEFFDTLRTNVYAPFYLSRRFKSLLKLGGAIVNVSSTNGTKTVSPECLDYNISKIGLQSLTRDLAFAFKPNIRVNAVAVGWANTDMNKGLEDKYIREETEKIYLGRFAEPAEIANVVFFLASNEASYVNGEVVCVDGGM